MINPGGNVCGKRSNIPAFNKAMNSDTKCIVLAPTSSNNDNPGIQPDNIANSFRFQHSGIETDEGKVRAYGANVVGDPIGDCMLSRKLFSRAAVASPVVGGAVSLVST